MSKVIDVSSERTKELPITDGDNGEQRRQKERRGGGQ
jgi:hypothetical protein